jgi:diguanylate cyclase (GGDEF)-like protein
MSEEVNVEPDEPIVLFGENPAEIASHPQDSRDRVVPEGNLPLMKTVRDIPLWPIWVNPDHLVRTALVLMRGHNVSGLGVMEGNVFLGVVYIDDLAGMGEGEKVASAIRTDVEAVGLSTPLRRVAELMATRNLSRVPVVDRGKFLGIISAQDILRDIGRNFDPLTQLPWSDALREWGIKSLEEGRELTILFFDVDDFGQFNKRFGHLIGDRVLRRVADETRVRVTPADDLLCRYGGDEFVVGTLRSRGDAEALAAEIKLAIDNLQVDGAAMPISASVGIYGGRRTREREGTHYAATLDNLINHASKACTAAKAKRSERKGGAQGPVEPLTVTSVSVTDTERGKRAIVVLAAGQALFTGVFEGAGSAAVAAASAAASALSQFSPDALPVEVLDVLESGDGPSRVVTLVAARGGRPVAVSVPPGPDPVHGVVRLILDTFGE